MRYWLEKDLTFAGKSDEWFKTTAMFINIQRCMLLKRTNVAEENGSCTETEKSEGEISESLVRRRSLRRSTIVLRKRPVQKLSNRTKFEVCSSYFIFFYFWNFQVLY